MIYECKMQKISRIAFMVQKLFVTLFPPLCFQFTLALIYQVFVPFLHSSRKHAARFWAVTLSRWFFSAQEQLPYPWEAAAC